MDFDALRTKMVDNQLRTSDVTDRDVLSAFKQVPREAFVPAARQPLAYIDEDIPLGDGRFLMEPSPLGKLLQLASVKPRDVVLDIGCATGYSSALLSQLCGSVVSLECSPALAETASDTLSRLGYVSCAVVEGGLAEGYASEAPFDVIFVGGSVEQLPAKLFDQLREGGRLVVVQGVGNAAMARLFLKEGGLISDRFGFNCSVKPLPGFEKAREFEF